ARNISVSRDKLGVPHIDARSEEDALFVQGYVTAEDRMWQMDGLRRLAAGDLAEIVGPAALEQDRDSRRLRLRRIAEEASLTMPARDRAAFAAYARGVNYFLETHRKNLSFEFAVLGYSPRPWSIVDSILIGLHMFRTLTTSWPDEIEKRNLLVGGDPAKVNFLFPPRAGGEVQPGSNAWAIAGARTASGKPLLSNDMHLEYSIPGIWFMTALKAPGLNVSGVSLPGVPGIVVGHNDRIAWGVTNLHFDVQDLYMENLDERTGQYLFRGKTEQAQLEREIIRIKGREPEEMPYWVTRHGPVILTNGSGRFALRWTAGDPSLFQFPFPDLNRARNWVEFNAALSRFSGPGQNFVYADVDGNIGYRAAGKLPVRRKYLGDVPVDGSSGDFEWDGYIPFEEMPSAYNPPNGLVVTANQNPFPAGYLYQVNGNFASPFRSGQIRDMLLAQKGLRPADTLRIQKDVYSAFSHYLARALVTAYDRRKASNPDLTDAIAILRSWNGQMEKSLSAPLIVTLAFQYVRKAAANRASPGNGALYDTQMSAGVVDRLLRTRPEGWFNDYDEILVRSLLDAIDEGRRMQGRDVKKWIYGKYLQLRLFHPVGHQLPLFGNYFDVGSVMMSGGSTTVKQTTRRLGPSMRMNADLGDWENSLLNLPVGESGHVLSRHYKDEWDAYYNGTSFPMPFQKVDAKSTVVFSPQ
ncbi:MAG: penicillin acylase family protein, partial [Acidobacteriota bacterium]|nr:penicillin acylase family protein [Acidobacteriota bacterium]